MAETDLPLDDVMLSTTEATNTTESFVNLYMEEHLAFLYVLFVFIILGNALVIVAILASKNRKSRMHIFILNLAIADLLAGLINVLTDIISKNTTEWKAGEAGCKIVRFSQGVVTYASTFALVALSIDRLNAIARPLSFNRNRFCIRLLIGLDWGLAMTFAVPMMALFEVRVENGIVQCSINFPYDWIWKPYVTSIAAVLFFIPAIIIAICYIIIVIIIWRKTSMSHATQNNTSHLVPNGSQVYVASNNSRFRDGAASSRGVIPRAKMKTIKMTLVIVLVFIVCWSPFFIFDLLFVYGIISRESMHNPQAVTTFIQSLTSLNSAANPIIYAAFNSNVCINLFCYRKKTNRSEFPVPTTRSTGTGPRNHLRRDWTSQSHE